MSVEETGTATEIGSAMDDTGTAGAEGIYATSSSSPSLLGTSIATSGGADGLHATSPASVWIADEMSDPRDDLLESLFFMRIFWCRPERSTECLVTTFSDDYNFLSSANDGG